MNRSLSWLPGWLDRFGPVRMGYAYLALPWVPFAVLWLRWWAAVLVLLGVGLALYGVLARRPADDPQPALRWRPGPVVVGGLVLYVVLAGAFGVGYQHNDWIKHHGVYRDLATGELPIVYETPSDARYGLNYYLAWYLPPAMLARLTSTALLPLYIGLWTLLGLATVYWLLGRVTRAPPLLCLLILVFFSGLDLLGHNLLKDVAIPNLEHLEGYTGMFIYPSHTNAFFWAPQQALPAWIGALLLLWPLVRDRDGPDHGLLLLALVGFWAPLVAVGLAPFVAYTTIRRPGRALHLTNALGLLLGGLAVLYFAANVAAVPHAFVWEFFPVTTLAVPLFAFLVFEAIIPLLVVAPFARRLHPQDGPRLLLVAAAVLLLLPLYRVGLWNDLAMRASMVALFVVAVTAAIGLHADVRRLVAGKRSGAVPFLLVLGAFTTVGPVIWVLSQWQWTVARSTDSRPVADLFGPVSEQYLGHLDAPFYRWFVRSPTTPVETSTEPVTALDLDIHRHDTFDQFGKHRIRLHGFSPPEDDIVWSTVSTPRIQFHTVGRAANYELVLGFRNPFAVNEVILRLDDGEVARFVGDAPDQTYRYHGVHPLRPGAHELVLNVQRRAHAAHLDPANTVTAAQVGLAFTRLRLFPQTPPEAHDFDLFAPLRGPDQGDWRATWENFGAPADEGVWVSGRYAAVTFHLPRAEHRELAFTFRNPFLTNDVFVMLDGVQLAYFVSDEPDAIHSFSRTRVFTAGAHTLAFFVRRRPDAGAVDPAGAVSADQAALLFRELRIELVTPADTAAVPSP